MTIRSRKYLDASRGQDCTFQIPGVCNYDPETTVPCHLNSEQKGMGIRSPDVLTADGCANCHSVIDGHTKSDLTKEDKQFYEFRALKRTLVRRAEQGYLKI